MKKSNSGTWVQVILVTIIVIFIIGLGGIRAHWDEHETVIKVTKAERIQKGRSSYYLVFTDSGAYTVADSTWRWTFDASDRYGKIKEGGTYKCVVTGWRWPFMSSYQNLLTIEPVPED